MNKQSMTTGEALFLAACVIGSILVLVNGIPS
jgi:hypothetical protein